MTTSYPVFAMNKKPINYIFKHVGDTFVVWLEPANRYLHLQEPAFRILKDWANQIEEEPIIWNCMKEYELPLENARLFVKDVILQLDTLVSNGYEQQIVSESDESGLNSVHVSFSTKVYSIDGQIFQFNYGDPYLEELIHPGFESQECKINGTEPIHSFSLFYRGDLLILQLKSGKSYQCSGSKIEHFIGLINLQLINVINQTTDRYWMGAVHASAISAGKDAVLFTAPSGSGKSTFAALLYNLGYQVLSDDFAPISLNQPKVYSFPEGISVKNRSLKVLQSYFPELAELGDSLDEDVREVFLPVSRGQLPEPKPVKAIVFLKYDATVGFEMKRISNLDAMDRFLQQLWLPPTNEVARQFMDWYFQIPCYTLRYSDAVKALDSVSGLFH